MKKYIEEQANKMKRQRERFDLAEKEMEEARYKHWKALNEEFMLRYMKEFIQQKLVLEFNESYSGYFTLDLKVGSQTLNTVSGQINTEYDSYQE